MNVVENPKKNGKCLEKLGQLVETQTALSDDALLCHGDGRPSALPLRVSGPYEGKLVEQNLVEMQSWSKRHDLQIELIQPFFVRRASLSYTMRLQHQMVSSLFRHVSVISCLFDSRAGVPKSVVNTCR